MMDNGYVICLLKYIIGNGRDGTVSWNTLSENRRPVSLGYFGRIHAVRVEQFWDYMDIASTHNAGFTGNRKQLLLYPLGITTSDQIRFQEYEEVDAERLPFQPIDGSGKRPCFCCLSILNIDQAVKRRVCGTNYSQGIRKIAGQISAQLDAYARGDENGTGVWLPYEVMGLLGTEDLCVIFLSDSFDAIYNGINRLRRLEMEEGTRVLDNSHSIMVVDFSEHAERPKWGDAMAELHFSLKSADGLKYIRKVKKAIAQYEADQGVAPEDRSVVLESQIGEYDATIRCPAALLGDYLYGYDQMLNYVTAPYRTAAYQSETLLFKNIDTVDEEPIRVPLDAMPAAGSLQFGEGLADEVVGLVKDKIEEICQCLEDPEDIQRDRSHTNSSYVSQVLHRLLKDFMRTASIPAGGIFQNDLSIQFQVTINAIVYIAQKYKVEREIEDQASRKFNENFSQIVEAMSKSMQAASQIDRFRFEEQQSHIQNTGAYHKVLLAYYGIVKAILELVYKVPRKPSSRQSMLIPLLSFGHTQIIYSYHFDSFYQETPDTKPVPAKLLCITLPYQALSNIPKYFGPLTHEIFHYASPADRESRNQDAGKCLIAIAFRCFLDQTAADVDQFGLHIFNRHRKVFFETVDAISDIVWENLEDQHLAYIRSGDESAISLDSVFKGMKSVLTPSVFNPNEDQAMELYIEGWADLRSRLEALKEELDDTTAAVFMIKSDQNEKEARESIKKRYRRCSGSMARTVEAFLSTYETFLREIPPDLFDISCIMYGAHPEEKAKQYLWQIHRIRSDKLYYNGRLWAGGDSITIDGNSLRFGVVLDHLIFGNFDDESIAAFGTRRKQIEERLESWYGGNGVQPQEQKKNREAIALDYEKYSTESLFANVMIQKNIRRVDEQVENLTGDPAAKEIMHWLSDFYREYYEILDREDEAKRTSDLFKLNIRIIEFYQCQQNLSELYPRSICAPVLLKKFDAPLAIYKAKKCETEVFAPAELSRAVTHAYEAMCPKGSIAPLWFRGQSDRDWSLLPNIMRPIKHEDETENVDADGFLLGMRKMLTLAQAKILPQGERYHKAEWLALLQHHEFKTTLLDWSENFHSALYFAIEPWGDLKEKPEKDASVRVLNPILYNLAKDMLEKAEEKEKNRDDSTEKAYNQSVDRLRCYLTSERDKGEEYAIPLFAGGCDEEQYRCYYDLSVGREKDGGPEKLPIAAMTPSTSDRMRMQAGVFTFCDVRAKPQDKDGVWSYSANDISNIQQRYFDIASKEEKLKDSIRPFLYSIALNRNYYKKFVQYLRAIGMRKYRMYPELTSLAKDIMTQSF